MTTSSGSTSSRIAGQILGLGRAEHLEPVLILHPQLARVVVDEPDRTQAQLRVSDQLADDQAPAVAAAHDQDVAGTLGGTEAAHPSLHDQMHEEAGADQKRQRKQQEQRNHASRQVHGGGLKAHHGGHRVQEGDRALDHQGEHDHALDDRLVVALAYERPQPLVLAEPARTTRQRGTTQGSVWASRSP